MFNTSYNVDANASASRLYRNDELVGVTEYGAQIISEYTGGDLFFIKGSDYPADYDSTTQVAHEEQQSGARPELENHIDNIDDYDVMDKQFIEDINRKKPKDMEEMAYLMNKGQISPPTSYYYNVIKQGYEANGMDTSYLRAELERSVCSQHYNNEQDEELYEREDFEEDENFQMTF